VEWFERELAAYRALAGARLSVVPRLLGRWEDQEIYPFPFAAVTRLRGQTPAAPEDLIEQLGRAIACWHELEPTLLAGARPPRHHDASWHRWLRRALAPATSASAAAEVADRLGRPDRASAWADLLTSAAQLTPGCGGAAAATSAPYGGRGWLAYAQVRGLETDSRPLETAFRLGHALRLLDDPGDPAVVGTIEEHLADL
jgi:hypothetical protein